MADTTHRYQPAGEIVATDVSHEDYLERYCDTLCEWVDGFVVKSGSSYDFHDELKGYFLNMLSAYTSLRPMARVKHYPFMLYLEKSSRQPDLMVILNDNPAFTNLGVQGRADICIEVVAPNTVIRDHVEKLGEYEQGGVTEYWIIDWMKHETRFYQLNDMRTYTRIPLDEHSRYHCKVLPGLWVHVPTLWRVPLPNYFDIGRAVQDMLGEESGE